MIVTCSNICKSFVDKKILDQVSFHIDDYDKVAIVGINGAGKTTLLRIIVNELSADSGTVAFTKQKTYGYFAQNSSCNGENTIYDELFFVKKELIELEKKIRFYETQMKHVVDSELDDLMELYAKEMHTFEELDGYKYRSEVVGVLKGLGFSEDEFTKKITMLSGGQRTRVALGKLLLKKPDLIILDEPTNHLDLNSISWLEGYLLNYKGAVLTVSHDRYFLDKIVTKVVEINRASSFVFSGNYSDYIEKKEHMEQEQLNAYLNQQQVIKHQTQVIEKLRSFNREKSIKRAESREKLLNKIDVLEKPTLETDHMKFSLVPNKISGNDVLKVSDLTKSFDQLTLFSDLTINISRGEHVAIIGDNGTGKTTLLKIINQILPASSGTLTLGTNVEIGYYDQEHALLHDEKSLFDEISDDYPNLTNTQIRNTLAAFLFLGDDVYKQIKELSGGERGRLSLAKLMLSNANFLILDEPTNHLDMQSKEILEQALNAYTGTILYVSHDRYFINKTATRILELKQKEMISYIGNYDYYLEKRETIVTTPKEQYIQEVIPEISESKLDYKVQKEQQAAKRKREKELEKLEQAIETCELAIKEIEQEMAKPEVCTNVSYLQELTTKLEEHNINLTNYYEQWEEFGNN
ncbi:MAG: ATP-binding cassette domain-containing protein [Lachnospiraceae bacterium]